MVSRNAIITLAVSGGLVAGILGLSCVKIKSDEYATINRTAGTVDIIVRGYHATPLSSDGPFPKWSRHLQIKINSPALIPDSESKSFSAGLGFSSRHDKVASGTLTIDPKRKVVVVDVKYATTYSFMRINGEYPIRD